MKKSGCGGDVQASAKDRQSSAPASRLSAPRRIVNARTYTAASIKERLTERNVESLCRAWLPKGKVVGQWWVCCSPFREDSDPSFGVSLTTKNWRDFGTGEGGDIIDLSMRLFGDTFVETLDGFAEMLGIKDA